MLDYIINNQIKNLNLTNKLKDNFENTKNFFKKINDYKSIITKMNEIT